MSEISTADMLEYLDQLWDYHFTEYSVTMGHPQGEVYEAIRAALLERDAMKAEVERLRGEWDLQHQLFEFWKARAEKAEDEVERMQRRIGDQRDHITELLAENYKQFSRAERAEAELFKLRTPGELRYRIDESKEGE